MDYTILFDHTHRTIASNGKSAYSDILYIPAGKTALLSLFNMTSGLDLVKDEVTGKLSLQSDDCAVVHKLSLGQTGDISRRLDCGERADIAGELRGLLLNRRLFHEPVYQCGSAWTLNPCNNFALIPTAGFYMLEFFDVNQFDTAYVEYTILSVADSLAIPDSFKMGS